MIATPTRGTRAPSIAGIARTLVAIAVAQPRIAAAIETVLRAEDRFDIERIADGADLPRRAGLVIVDGGFLERMPAPLLVPSVVILESGTDRTALEPRAPGARGWLQTTSTGEEVLAAIDRALRPPAVPETDLAARPIAATEVRTTVAADREATEPGTARDVAILLFGTACAAISLVMVWMALRP